MKMFMDPTYDKVFKKLFGTNDHKNLCLSLINALCEYEGDNQVVELTFLGQETVPGNDLIRGGNTMVDIYCETRNKHKFIIEIQRKPENEILERLMLYFAQMYIGQYDYKLGFEKLFPVVVIAINNTIPAFSHITAYKTIHKLCNVQTHEQDIKQLSFVLVELEKFAVPENQLTTDEEKWLYLIKTIGNAVDIPAPLQTGVFQEACNLLNLMTKSTMERMEYTNGVLYAQSMDSTYRAEQVKAKDEGKAEAKITFAKTLLAEGMSVEQAARLAGLSVEEINKW